MLSIIVAKAKNNIIGKEKFKDTDIKQIQEERLEKLENIFNEVI